MRTANAERVLQGARRVMREWFQGKETDPLTLEWAECVCSNLPAEMPGVDIDAIHRNWQNPPKETS